jgi:hypothetical protein
MPVKSEKQKRWLHANEQDIAERWENESKPRRERTRSKKSRKRKNKR